MTNLIPAWKEGTLKPVNKIEVHERGLRHKAISVFVFCKDQTLIQQRSLTKYHTPGLWANTCCTHPDWNEKPLKCALRRLDEELGITNLNLLYKDQIEYTADVGNGMIEHELVDIFVSYIHNKDQLKIRTNPDEVMATTWLPINSLVAQVHSEPKKFTPWLKIYLSNHLNQILKN